MNGKNPIPPPDDMQLFIMGNFYLEDTIVHRSDGYFGSLNRDGYFQFKIRDYSMSRGSKYITILAHHIAWFLNYGEWPTQQIDHKDRDKTNNGVGNLEYTTNRENRNNTPYEGMLPRGVKQKKNGYFEAYANVGGKKVYLGHSKDAYVAGLMYENFIKLKSVGRGENEN